MGKNIYARNMPKDLYYRLKRLQQELDCSTWITFFYEVDRIVTKYLHDEKGITLKREE